MACLAWKNVTPSTEIGFQFHSFDQDYLRRLAGHDAVIEQHFSSYFKNLLSLKLRVRIRSLQLIEDIRQETLLRVLQIVRRNGVEHPERFGAFVVLSDESFNSLAQLIFGFEACSVEGLALQQAEYDFNLVQPTGRSRREMKLDPPLELR